MLLSCVYFSLPGTIPVPKIDKEIDNILKIQSCNNLFIESINKMFSN
jgi:hypothetical protein